MSFIFYRVHVTRRHRVPIDRSSWIQLDLTQLQGVPTPFRSRRLPCKNQLFHQSTSMLDGHGRIIPVSDYQARTVSRLSVRQRSATLPSGSSGVSSFILHPDIHSRLLFNCRIKSPKKTVRPTDRFHNRISILLLLLLPKRQNTAPSLPS